MKIEEELLSFLQNNIKEGSKKNRDIKIISYYYGFKEAEWPTLEETGKRYNIATRERVRQIINNKFKIFANPDSFKTILKCIDIIKRKRYWSESELVDLIIQENLSEGNFNIRGLFNLMDDLGIDHGFEIYTPDLKKATRNTIALYEENFILAEENIKNIKSFLRKSQKIAGRCGIANLSYLKDEIDDYKSFSHLVEDLIRYSENAWTEEREDGFWYIFEDRDNTLVNYSEKIFSSIDSCDANRLAATYRNALDGRTFKYPYPPEDIIEEYLRSSVYFENDDDILSFIGEAGKLNEIDVDVIDYLKSKGTVKYPEFSAYLDTKGYTRPHIVKAITSSPIVFVDKSKGRTRYEYSLVNSTSHPIQKTSTSKDKYKAYLLRLRKFHELGTDETIQNKRRREQGVLQDWLFNDKDQESCAICGNTYSVKTLVTAHKKKRSQCHEAERLDPNIVMPVCVMGCDYLYEKQHIYVENGIIRKGLPLEHGRDENTVIDDLVGRQIDDKWLKGPASYFLPPNKKKCKS